MLSYLLSTLLFLCNLFFFARRSGDGISIVSLLVVHSNFIRIEKIHKKFFPYIYIPSIITLVVFIIKNPSISPNIALFATFILTSFISGIFLSIKGFTLWDKGGIRINSRIIDFILVIYYFILNPKLSIWISIISASSSYFVRTKLLL